MLHANAISSLYVAQAPSGGGPGRLATLLPEVLAPAAIVWWAESLACVGMAAGGVLVLWMMKSSDPPYKL